MNFIRKENNMYNEKISIVLGSRSEINPKTITLDNGAYAVNIKKNGDILLAIAIPYPEKEILREYFNTINTCESVLLLDVVENQGYKILYIKGDIIIVYK